MQITTTLTKAAPRLVTPKSGANPFTLYELYDHEGTAWVVKNDVYNLAQGWIGQPVDMVVRVEQNGNFTNRYADLVQPAQAGAQVPATNAVQQAFQAAQAAQRVQATMPQTPNTPKIQDVNVFPTRKDSSIHRQTAAKVAAEISTSPAEFWSNVIDLAKYFDTGVIPTSLSQDYAMTGAGYDNSPPPHSDSDVPF